MFVLSKKEKKKNPIKTYNTQSVGYGYCWYSRQNYLLLQLHWKGLNRTGYQTQISYKRCWSELNFS